MQNFLATTCKVNRVLVSGTRAPGPSSGAVLGTLRPAASSCAGPRKQTAYQPAPIFKGRNQEGRHLSWKPLTSFPQSSLPRWTQQSPALLLFSSHLQRREATVSPTCPLLLPCRHPLLHLLCALTKKGEGCPHHPTNPHHSLTKVGAPRRRLEAQSSCGFNTKTV